MKRKLDTATDLAPDSGVAHAAAAPSGPAVCQKLSPVVTAKAVKNASEIAGMKEAHLADAVAICQFLLMVEEKVCAALTMGNHSTLPDGSTSSSCFSRVV